MYLSIHATAGVLIGSYTNSSLIAFVVGFFSHFLLDMVPHRDGKLPIEDLSIKQIRRRYFDKIVAIVYLDLCVSTVVAGALLTNNLHFITPSILWGIIGSIAPDVLQIFAFMFPRVKPLQRFQELHNTLHYNPKRQKISLVAGHLTQLLTLLTLIRPLV